MPEDETVAKLIEEHKDDFPAADTGADDQADTSGGDIGDDKPKDEVAGATDSGKDDEAELPDPEKPAGEEESGEDKAEPVKSDDIIDAGAEPVGEKKDANSRIRQILEEKKQIQAEKDELAKKLAAKEIEERRINDLAEDPIYTVDDFIGTLDEQGEVLSDREATARFRAWDADYKLRQYQKREVLKEQQDTLIKMQSETQEAFTKFPEFNKHSDVYDKDLADIANEAFSAGLIYSKGHDGSQDGDDAFIIGSRVNPGQLLEKLHKLRAKEDPITKVNNLGDDAGPVVSSQQVNKKATKYAPGFRGEVDAARDQLIKGGK